MKQVCLHHEGIGYLQPLTAEENHEVVDRPNEAGELPSACRLSVRRFLYRPAKPEYLTAKQVVTTLMDGH